MRKVTTYQLIDGIKKNLMMIIIPALIFFGLVFSLGFVKLNKSYEASAVLMATADKGEPISYNKLVLNEKLANIYGEILKSPDLYKKVEQTLKKGGSELDYKDIMGKVDYEVNPQAGMVSLTYQDSNADRAGDSLKSICENFRIMVKTSLATDNLSYIQDVLVEKTSKKKSIIFSILALIAGAMFGLIIVILKILLSDRIASYDDLLAMGVDVLGDNEQILKIKSKIESRLEEGIIGFTSLGKSDSFEFSQNLARAFASNNGLLYIDSKDKLGIDDKYLTTTDDFKIIRKENIDYVRIPSKISGEILDSNEFFAGIVNRERQYNYIFVDEKHMSKPDSYLSSKFEDIKIILVDNQTNKKDLDTAIKDFRDLGINYCGVIFYK